MTPERDAVYESVNQLADWSSWEPFEEAAPLAPLVPGVYQMRIADGTIVYVGMAGLRLGQGIRGRLSIYRRGKGAVSGFGEAALDRALADAGFVEDHLTAVRAGNAVRASVWAQDAIRWLDVEVRWAACETKEDADALESAAVDLLKLHGIWNRVALRAARRLPLSVPAFRRSSAVPTVNELSVELGFDDHGRAVRRVLRAGFPDHTKGASWDPLSTEAVAYVRATLAP